MVQKNVKLINPTGLSVHPAGVLCKEAVSFKCSIHFQFNNVVSNAKSVLSVLGAQIRCNDEITLICDGVDEKEALERISEIIAEGLGE